MSLDNVTLVWAIVTTAVVVVAFAIGYLLGQADGLREGLARSHERKPKRPNPTDIGTVP